MIVVFPNITISYHGNSQTWNNITVPVELVDGWYVVKPENWAPGIWAGSETMTVKLDGTDVLIAAVDLQNNRVKLIGRNNG